MTLSTPLRATLGTSIAALLCVGLPVMGAVATFGAAEASAPTAAFTPTCAAAPGLPSDEIESIQEKLELTPNDPALLLAAAEASFANDDDDRALWYAELARFAADGTEAARDTEKKVRALRDEIGVEIPPLGQAIDAYSKDVFNFAKLAVGQKYFANAADFLGSLEGSPYEREASSRLEKLFKKKKAVEAMLESGVPVRITTRKRRTDAEIQRLDKRHSDWENAYVVEGTNYTVKTDMGVVMAEKMLNAMEQMNAFYRQIFEHKARGGTMRRCEVRVWKSRDEFDQYESVEPEVKGFYRPGENNVSTYDPRTEKSPGAPKTLEDLWSTLYHEASHQFTRAIWKNLIPTWLNEGTASYFEGAALLPGGVVETNRIPTSRLISLISLLGVDDLFSRKKEGSQARGSGKRYTEHDDSPGLETVVSFIAPGSYPGSYYPFGWGLVYFCLNYENEDSERIYAPIYKKFMRSYTKNSGEKPLKRFITYFIEEPKIEGIETFEDFENQWIDWIVDLARYEFGDEDQADRLIARARIQVANGHPEYAADSLRWALRKRPEDPTALMLLGQCYVAVENHDAALFTFRTLARVARDQDAEGDLEHFEGTAGEALKAAHAGLESVKGSIGAKVAGGVSKFIDASLKESSDWVEAGYPRVGLQAIALATDLVGSDSRLRKAAAKIQKDKNVTIGQTQRIPVTDLVGWSVLGEVEASVEGYDQILTHDSDRPFDALVLRAPRGTYRFDVDVEILDLDEETLTLAGIAFAAGPTETKRFVRLGGGGLFGLLEFDADSGQPTLDRDAFKRGPRTEEGKLTMSVEVGPIETKLYVNDKEVASYERPPSVFAGQVGVTSYGPVKFTNPRLTY